MNTEQLQKLEKQLLRHDWTLCYDSTVDRLMLLGGSANGNLQIHFHDQDLFELVPKSNAKIYLTDQDQKLIDKVRRNFEGIMELARRRPK